MSGDGRGILYVIGVGPGDPELLTMKAFNVLKEVPVLCVPKGREEGKSLALSIISGIVDTGKKRIIEAHFPMIKTRAQSAEHRTQSTEHRTQSTDKRAQNTENRAQRTEHGAQTKDDGQRAADDRNSLQDKWDEIAGKLMDEISGGNDVAFITLGDPTIYSTFFYLHERLLQSMPGIEVRVIPGISSINASAAAAGMSLGLADEKIAVLPANYEDEIEAVIRSFDTVVLMKVHRVFDRVREILDRMGLVNRATYVIRAGMGQERIFTDLSEVGPEDLDYFSTLIIKK